MAVTVSDSESDGAEASEFTRHESQAGPEPDPRLTRSYYDRPWLHDCRDGPYPSPTGQDLTASGDQAPAAGSETRRWSVDVPSPGQIFSEGGGRSA